MKPAARGHTKISLFPQWAKKADLATEQELTPGEIRRRLADYDPFIEEVLEKGRVLYEAKRKD